MKEFILNQPALEVPMLGPWVRKHEVGFVDYKVGWKEFKKFLCLNLKEKKVFERTFGDFGLSFFNYKASSQRTPKFKGLDNYADVLTDEKIWERFQTTAVIVASSVLLQLIVGFLLALLFAKAFPLRRIVLMLVLTPMMLSFVSVGVFFKLFYEPTFGIVSYVLNFYTTEKFVIWPRPLVPSPGL